MMVIRPKGTAASSSNIGPSSSYTPPRPNTSSIVKAAEPPSLTVAKNQRKDKPPVKDSTRGDKRKALEIAATPELLIDAIEVFEKEVKSSGGHV